MGKLLYHRPQVKRAANARRISKLFNYNTNAPMGSGRGPFSKLTKKEVETHSFEKNFNGLYCSAVLQEEGFMGRARV